MDANTLIVLVVIIFATLIAFTFLLFRKNASAKIHAGSISMEVSGANDSANTSPNEGLLNPDPMVPVGTNISNAKSSEGGLFVDEQDGGGVRVHHVETKDDIIVSRKGRTP